MRGPGDKDFPLRLGKWIWCFGGWVNADQTAPFFGESLPPSCSHCKGLFGCSLGYWGVDPWPYTSRRKVALLEFFKITNPFPIESYMLHVVHVSEILRSDFHTYKPFDIIYLKGCGNLTVLYLPHKTHSQM